jgi:hypothetical protein
MRPSMRLIKWSGYSLLPALCLLPSLAFAQLDAKREALQHYDRAITLMKEGAHHEAIPELQRAYDLGHENIVLYDLGQA